jgi:hypothetical protein
MYYKTALTIYTGNINKSTQLQCAETEVIFFNNKITPLDRYVILPYGLRMSLTRQKETYNNIDGDEEENEYTDALVMTNYNAKQNNSNNEIIIPYGLRTSIGDNEIVFHKHGDVITNNTSPNQLEFPFGMKFDYDENNFIIKKRGDLTKGVKIPWTTL